MLNIPVVFDRRGLRLGVLGPAVTLRVARRICIILDFVFLRSVRVRAHGILSVFTAHYVYSRQT